MFYSYGRTPTPVERSVSARRVQFSCTLLGVLACVEKDTSSIVLPPALVYQNRYSKWAHIPLSLNPQKLSCSSNCGRYLTVYSDLCCNDQIDVQAVFSVDNAYTPDR